MTENFTDLQGIEYKAIVRKYLDLRAQKSELKSQYEEKLAPITDEMERIENFLSGELNRLGVKNIATDVGTILRTKWTRVTPTDWPKFIKFCKEQDRWDLIERRVAKTELLATMAQYEEDGLPPIPGVEVETGLQVSIRKA